MTEENDNKQSVLKVLIACEVNGRVRDEFRKLGHDAWSCDIKGDVNGSQYHYTMDVRNILHYPWDMIIAFPPCTDLAVSGARHFDEKRRDGRQKKAIGFFMLFANHACRKIAIENPVGIISNEWRKPDQIIQPWQFGDSYQKTTCLWLKGLTKLVPTKIVDRGEIIEFPSGKRMPKWYAEKPSTNNPKNAAIRSATFPGIANAMAKQWGKPVGLEAFVCQ